MAAKQIAIDKRVRRDSSEEVGTHNTPRNLVLYYLQSKLGYQVTQEGGKYRLAEPNEPAKGTYLHDLKERGFRVSKNRRPNMEQLAKELEKFLNGEARIDDISTIVDMQLVDTSSVGRDGRESAFYKILKGLQIGLPATALRARDLQISRLDEQTKEYLRTNEELEEENTQLRTRMHSLQKQVLELNVKATGYDAMKKQVADREAELAELEKQRQALENKLSLEKVTGADFRANVDAQAGKDLATIAELRKQEAILKAQLVETEKTAAQQKELLEVMRKGIDETAKKQGFIIAEHSAGVLSVLPVEANHLEKKRAEAEAKARDLGFQVDNLNSANAILRRDNSQLAAEVLVLKGDNAKLQKHNVELVERVGFLERVMNGVMSILNRLGFGKQVTQAFDEVEKQAKAEMGGKGTTAPSVATLAAYETGAVVGGTTKKAKKRPAVIYDYAKQNFVPASPESSPPSSAESSPASSASSTPSGSPVSVRR